MKNLYFALALALSFFSTPANAQEAVTERTSYSLVIWADLIFDQDSRLSQITIQEKDALSKPFAGFLMNAIATGPFNKPENAEANKQLETGLKVVVEIDPATSKAKILSQDLMPRPIRVEHRSEPVLRVKGEWSGRIKLTCTITANGRCAKPRMNASANAPNEISKILLGILASWRFVPAKRAGTAIESEFNTWVTIEADTTMPPTKFDKSI